MTSDVLVAKLASIDRCLPRIRTVTRGDPSSVRQIDKQEIAVRSTGGHRPGRPRDSSRNRGLPDSLKQHVTILEQNGLLRSDLADRLRSMVGFRNIVVHDYQALDPAILEQVVAKHLGDLEEFAEAMRSAAGPS